MAGGLSVTVVLLSDLLPFVGVKVEKICEILSSTGFQDPLLRLLNLRLTAF
jgi:hypothetical protein